MIAFSFSRCLIITFTLIFVSSCGTDSKSNEQDNKIRLITLSPHLAELVASAGAIDNLVGVVSYSDFPEEIKSITNIGDAFKVDFETIIALNPDYVVSWKSGTPVAVVEKLKSLNIKVMETKINSLSDIPTTIKKIANLTNTQNYAQLNIELFEKTIEQLKQNKKASSTIFIETYHQPIYSVSGSHWMSEAVKICGYENIFTDLSQSSAAVNIESIINKNPETILNISKEIDPQWQKWQSISAVKNNRIYTIDPDIMSRPSMRLLEGVKQLCAK